VSEGATVVAATYDDGSPMAFCDVTVFGPDAREEPYQEGTSDRNGCFAFLPDTNGTWTVTVDDGMGHVAEARIDIDSAGGRRSEEAHHADRLSGAVVGISVIFGCFGVYAMLSGWAQRRRRSEETGA
jgi:nickel transport protein